MTPESDSPSRRRLFGRAKIDFVQSSTSRACRFRPKVNREPFQSPPKEQAVMEDDVEPSILLQPETFPITPEQVVVEVKEIYPGLVMLESKCAEVDNKQQVLFALHPTLLHEHHDFFLASQHSSADMALRRLAFKYAMPARMWRHHSFEVLRRGLSDSWHPMLAFEMIFAQAHSSTQPKLNHAQWQALIALHQTLLHEHHDFFLTSQHFSAETALRHLASKYAMPARVWRHGIHSSLEVFRHGLPDSRDPMLVFIYLAYSMIALLYDTAFIFDDTWIKCLGDLARYRMAIEDDDIREREAWTRVAKLWYSKASDKSPTIRRLYHHLAISARPSARSRQYHAKSLFCQFPFVPAREPISTLFQPIPSGENGQRHCRPLPLDNVFVGAYDLLFNKEIDTFDSTVTQFVGLFEDQIGRVIVNIASIFDFGDKYHALMKAMFSSVADLHEQVEESEDSSLMQLKDAILPHHRKLEGLLSSIDDPNMLSFLHVTLLFIYRKSRHPAAITLIEAGSSWRSLALYLNTLRPNYDFPRDYIQPLPEDCFIRGLLYVDQYHPNTWFNHQERDEDENGTELPSMIVQRQDRILRFGRSITKVWPSIVFDSKILYFLSSKLAVNTGPILSTEQQGYQIAVTNSVGMSKLIAKGVSLMQSVPWSSEDNSHPKQSSFWTESPSFPQSSSSRMLHLFDVIQTHGHLAHHDSRSNPSSRQVTPSIESKSAFTNVNRTVGLIRYTRVVKRFLQRQSARFFWRKDQAFIVAIAVVFGGLPNAMARPLNTSTSSALSAEVDDSGFSQFWKDMWNQFKDQYSGPLVMNILWASFLASLFFLVMYHDKGKWKETDLLAIATWCTSAASFFLGMGDWLSDWQLAFLWVFNAKLNLRLLGRNLLSLPRSRDLTSICIITMGFVSAGTLAQRVPLEDGRYANHWILTAMLAPFMTCFVIHTWSVFIRDTGIARGLEEGTYHRVTARLWQQIYRLSQQIFFAIVALIVLRLLS